MRMHILCSRRKKSMALSVALKPARNWRVTSLARMAIQKLIEFFCSLLVFALVHYFHRNPGPLETTQTLATELKPFFAISGTSMCAKVIFLSN
jgi:hypothetical protein